jgi:hypothetical protein
MVLVAWTVGPRRNARSSPAALGEHSAARRGGGLVPRASSAARPGRPFRSISPEGLNIGGVACIRRHKGEG